MAAVDFAAIREQITAREAAELYGITVNRYGMALCPFHEDRHPSLKLDERFHCFGCGADGSVIDFAAQLFGLSLSDAARKLADDFGISEMWSASTSIRTTQRPQKPCMRSTTKELEALYHSVLCDYYRRLQRWKEQYAPKVITEDFHPLFIEALKNEAYIEYLLDVLIYGSDDERTALIKEQAHNVATLERQFSSEALQKGA